MLFLRKSEVVAIQVRLIDQFGGIQGLRDEGALEAALAAVENRVYYEQADLVTCAATYAFHLSQAHAFLDGNKRVAAAAAEIFLELNDAYLNTTDPQVIALFLGIAAGAVSRDEVERQFREWVVPGP